MHDCGAELVGFITTITGIIAVSCFMYTCCACEQFVHNVNARSPPPNFSPYTPMCPVVQLRKNPPSPLNKGKRISGTKDKFRKSGMDHHLFHNIPLSGKAHIIWHIVYCTLMQPDLQPDILYSKHNYLGVLICIHVQHTCTYSIHIP